MSTKATLAPSLEEPKKKRSFSRSPARKANGNTKSRSTAVKSYKSDGVTDQDIFSLPGSDWQLLALITIIGAVVRLWKINQPTSVVFDEVQYVQPDGPNMTA
jgi:dolichyl-phosphate-mannose-protein mannosyltransferase